jgi:hypothetical protein
MWQSGVFVGLPYIDGDCPMAFKGAGSAVMHGVEVFLLEKPWVMSFR